MSIPEDAALLAGIAEPDDERVRRRGIPEAVYGAGKTPAQLAALAEHTKNRAANDRAAAGNAEHTDQAPPTTLFTRLSAEQAAAVLEVLPDAEHDELAGLIAWPPTPPAPSGGLVVVVCAGTSDLPVAREAERTARHLGRPTHLVVDVGVAGLHRVVRHLPHIRQASAVVVVAGMDGALPGVVAGLVSAPVVAVPTSVGYGAAFEGVAPLLTMLNACAPGVGVVNIDNGYGAGHLAAQIAGLAPDHRVEAAPDGSRSLDRTLETP